MKNEEVFDWMLSAAQEINRVQLSRDHVIKDSFGMKHPIMRVEEQVEIMQKHFQSRVREEKECPLCGSDCVGGAHRNALAEDGIETRDQLEALRKQESEARQAEDAGQVKKEQKRKTEAVPARPKILRGISGARYFLDAEEVAVEYVLALEAVVEEYRKAPGTTRVVST